MQIRAKLTLQFTLLVSVIVLAIFVVIYWLRHNYIEEEFYKRLTQKATTSAELLVSVKEVNAKLLKKIEKANNDVLYRENLIIYDYKNLKVYSRNDTSRFKISPEMLNQIRKQHFARFKQGEFKIVGMLYTDRFNRVVTVAGAVDVSGKKDLQNLLGIMIWLFLCVFLLVTFVGYYFSVRALSPISEVIQQVQTIYPQNVNQRLTIQNPKDEIGRLTATFNELLERISEVFRLQNLFVSNVSHEMKNPLMKIGSQIDVALLKSRSPEEYLATLQSVRQDIREMGQLSNTLLELAKVSDLNHKLMYDEVRLDETIWEAGDLLLQAEQNYQVQVDFADELEEDTQLVVKGNAQLLKTAFVNLMENGCKFSENHLVKVSLHFLKDHIEVQFTNHGKMEKPEIDLIFEPFYRSQNTASIKGYGVGLSLVNRIVKLHGGNIKVQCAGNQTVFVLWLPYSVGGKMVTG
ncbi:HAMP domain-containing sensor histidine kinase [Arcicella sp. LKC2W]|uniref:HAMP domain-containing sensor histidine kinase n=1 Tax=Arcicella sp. LKC2W TaxID=2984198 RepID=UPI002B1FA5F4|nr:HAMP domain-containing sensor histidine kinase [Arcicella sp. LKC2W]MEA5460099.1 HAMP domain-containing sensor histidine kinase [Arcicella sp. LKC2W]